MKALFLILTLFISNAFAACPNLYPNGKEIVVPDTIELCNTSYVTRYNVKTNSAIFSAEILQPMGHKIYRTNDFHEDSRLPTKISPAHYLNTGYDKGHLTPADDATTAKEMSETFLMSNMTAQKPLLNRINWCHLEDRTRKDAEVTGKPIHVVTGAIYGGTEKIGNLIPVPTGYYKVVYLPTITKVFYADNKNDAVVTSITMEQLKQKIGYSLE